MLREEPDTGGLYAEVVIALPLEKTFHYAIPLQLRPICETGARVLVPLGKRKVTGYVLGTCSDLPAGIKNKDIKEIIDCLDKAPLFDEGMLQFFRWIADYYLAPLGQVIKTALPPGINWESSYHVSLTPEGRRAVAEGSSDQTPAGRVLQAIDPHAGSPFKGLLKLHPHRSLFFSLEKKGLISLEARAQPGRTKAKKAAFVEVVPSSHPLDALTPKERETLSFIEEQGRPSLKELRKRFRSASAALKALVAKGMVQVIEEEVYREPILDTVEREEGLISLTPEQQAAVEQIAQALREGAFRPFLLHGITGSGKTEVYLRAVQAALALGKQAVILVPEISLTPQLVGRFQKRLGIDMALLHSGLAPGERYDQWRKARRGEVRVVIGARSAVFAPCKDLGLIVVDEEHDTSYKQEDGVRYNARDLAVMRAQKEGAVVVLGSATPSLESFYNAQQGRYKTLLLPNRVGGGVLPTVEIVDLKRENYALFSPALRDALAENLAAGRQSLLFLNRRGFSHAAICADCGAAFTCRQCSVSLTYHARSKALLCHYCGYHLPAFQICPLCGGGKIRLLGVGTEKVEGEVRQLFPGARVARMDSDVMIRRGAQGRVLRALEQGEIDILVGTQMIVKGHDFPQITLVGIIAADVALHLPELRAAERCFQLISQAAGRAGRGRHPGRVIIQTFLPEHYAIQRAKEHDFLGFYEEEMKSRQALRFPPLTRMVNIRVSAGSPQDAEQGIQRLAKKGIALLKNLRGAVEMLGPSPAPLYQIKGRYRWQLLFKGERVALLQQLSRSLVQEGKGLKKATIEVDVDPLSLL
jgi:primosomal protein N' (replication factor Y) (superfamily II helicase)